MLTYLPYRSFVMNDERYSESIETPKSEAMIYRSILAARHSTWLFRTSLVVTKGKAVVTEIIIEK